MPLRLPALGFTGIGSLPGTDFLDSVAMVFGESTGLPWLPELPARGPGSDLIGRTLAAITRQFPEFGFDLQPAGWRLVDRAGHDAAVAVDTLRSDVDALLGFADYSGPVKSQLAGPWTLAAAVELPRGGRALRDHGAVRDLTEALAATVPAHLADVAQRLPAATPLLQLDEPGVPAVMAGGIRTASGFGHLAALPRHDIVTGLGAVVAGAGGPVVLHCCADAPPLDVFADAGAAAVSFDATRLSRARLDEDLLGGLVERDVQLWLGALPSLGPGVAPPSRALADPVRRLWRSLGFAPERLAESIVLTPACGQAGASPGWVRESLRVLRQAAAAVSEAPDIVRS
jgi:hypothetical protein